MIKYETYMFTRYKLTGKPEALGKEKSDLKFLVFLFKTLFIKIKFLNILIVTRNPSCL